MVPIDISLTENEWIFFWISFDFINNPPFFSFFPFNHQPWTPTSILWARLSSMTMSSQSLMFAPFPFCLLFLFFFLSPSFPDELNQILFFLFLFSFSSFVLCRSSGLLTCHPRPGFFLQVTWLPLSLFHTGFEFNWLSQFSSTQALFSHVITMRTVWTLCLMGATRSLKSDSDEQEEPCLKEKKKKKKNEKFVNNCLSKKRREKEKKRTAFIQKRERKEERKKEERRRRRGRQRRLNQREARKSAVNQSDFTPADLSHYVPLSISALRRSFEL